MNRASGWLISSFGAVDGILLLKKFSRWAEILGTIQVMESLIEYLKTPYFGFTVMTIGILILITDSRRRKRREAILKLKAEARELRRCWPNSKFASAPLDRIKWSPEIGEARTVEQDKAIAWHNRFLEFNRGAKYPPHVDFDGMIEFLDQHLL